MRLLRAYRNHILVQWISVQLHQQFHIIVWYFVFWYNKCDKDLHRIWFLWLVSNKIGTLLPCSLPSTYTLGCSPTLSMSTLPINDPKASATTSRCHINQTNVAWSLPTSFARSNIIPTSLQDMLFNYRSKNSRSSSLVKALTAYIRNEDR